MSARVEIVERSGDSLGIAQTMLLDEIGDELALGDGELTIGTNCPVDINAQELCGRPQISQCEVLGELDD